MKCYLSREVKTRSVMSLCSPAGSNFGEEVSSGGRGFTDRWYLKGGQHRYKCLGFFGLFWMLHRSHKSLKNYLCDCAVTPRCSRSGCGGSGRLHALAASRCARRSALVILVCLGPTVSQQQLAQIGGRVWRGEEVRYFYYKLIWLLTGLMFAKTTLYFLSGGVFLTGSCNKTKGENDEEEEVLQLCQECDFEREDRPSLSELLVLEDFCLW